LEDGLTKVKAS